MPGACATHLGKHLRPLQDGSTATDGPPRLPGCTWVYPPRMPAALAWHVFLTLELRCLWAPRFPDCSHIWRFGQSFLQVCAPEHHSRTDAYREDSQKPRNLVTERVEPPVLVVGDRSIDIARAQG